MKKFPELKLQTYAIGTGHISHLWKAHDHMKQAQCLEGLYEWHKFTQRFLAAHVLLKNISRDDHVQNPC